MMFNKFIFLIFSILVFCSVQENKAAGEQSSEAAKVAFLTPKHSGIKQMALDGALRDVFGFLDSKEIESGSLEFPSRQNTCSLLKPKKTVPQEFKLATTLRLTGIETDLAVDEQDGRTLAHVQEKELSKPENYRKLIAYLNLYGPRFIAQGIKDIPTAIKFPYRMPPVAVEIALRSMNDSCKQLITSLDFSMLNNLGWESENPYYLEIIAQNFPNLRLLNISFCSWISVGRLEMLAQGLPHLEYLNISGCGLNFDIVRHSLMFPKLRQLDHCLGSCYFDEQHQWNAFESKVNLRDLMFYFGEGRSYESMISLDLKQFSNMKSDDLSAFVQSCPNLKYLVLSDWSRITQNEIQKFKALRPEVKVIHKGLC